MIKGVIVEIMRKQSLQVVVFTPFKNYKLGGEKSRKLLQDRIVGWSLNKEKKNVSKSSQMTLLWIAEWCQEGPAPGGGC